MAWLAVDEDGLEAIYLGKPYRYKEYWESPGFTGCIELPDGSIEKLIGKKLTWKDEPVRLEE